MKYVWEKEDIEDHWGRYVMTNAAEFKDDYKGLTHVFKIGGGTDGPALIAMGDGLVIQFKNREKLLEHLNNPTCGFRPMRRGELLEMISHNWHRHEGIRKETI